MQTIDRVLLRSTLSRIVPMWIATLKAEPWLYVEHRIRDALSDDITFDRQLLRCVAEQSAASQMAEFYRLGESVACCAFSAGGVTILDLHFQDEHPEKS